MACYVHSTPSGIYAEDCGKNVINIRLHLYCQLLITHKAPLQVSVTMHLVMSHTDGCVGVLKIV